MRALIPSSFTSGKRSALPPKKKRFAFLNCAFADRLSKTEFQKPEVFDRRFFESGRRSPIAEGARSPKAREAKGEKQRRKKTEFQNRVSFKREEARSFFEPKVFDRRFFGGRAPSAIGVRGLAPLLASLAPSLASPSAQASQRRVEGEGA